LGFISPQKLESERSKRNRTKYGATLFTDLKNERSPNAHRDFEQISHDFTEFGGYFPVPGTLNQLLMALVFSEMDTGKTSARSVWSF